MFTHRFVLGVVVTCLSLSALACSAQSAVGRHESLHDSALRTSPFNSPSSPPAPPTQIAQNSRRDRLH